MGTDQRPSLAHLLKPSLDWTIEPRALTFTYDSSDQVGVVAKSPNTPIGLGEPRLPEPRVTIESKRKYLHRYKLHKASPNGKLE